MLYGHSHLIFFFKYYITIAGQELYCKELASHLEFEFYLVCDKSLLKVSRYRINLAKNFENNNLGNKEEEVTGKAKEKCPKGQMWSVTYTYCKGKTMEKQLDTEVLSLVLKGQV